MHELSKYLDWDKIWDEEVHINLLTDDHVSNDVWEIIKQFKVDDSVMLDFSECQIEGDEIIFSFGETGGQTESDPTGWSREYWFKVKPDDDFSITDAGYEQG